MRTRVAIFALGLMLVGSTGVGWAKPTTVAELSRHSGVVEAVDAKAGTLTLEELGALGKKARLHVRVGPGVRLVRSERLPASQITDLQHPFKNSPITLAAVRPGDFLVVVIEGSGRREAVRSVTVTAEPGSHRSASAQASPAAAQAAQTRGAS